MQFQRPLQKKELGIINSRLRQFAVVRKRQNRFLVIWVLIALIVGSFAFFRMTPQGDIFILVVTVLIYIGIGFWIVYEQRKKEKGEEGSLHYLKDKNLVTSTVVKSVQYYQLTETYDEGDYYLFQLEHNKVLFFGGQDFYPTETFPSGDFEIVEGFGIKNELLLLEIYNNGIRTAPLLEITGQQKWDLLENSNWPDLKKITIVGGQIQDYIDPANSRSLYPDKNY